MLLNVQRKTAIRIVSVYRTTFTTALLDMAKTEPIHLLVEDFIFQWKEEYELKTEKVKMAKWTKQLKKGF